MNGKRGLVIAIVASWSVNHSVLWAIFHFLLGWIYVLWAAFMRTKEIVPALRAMFGV